jgi:hypothetical protein
VKSPELATSSKWILNKASYEADNWKSICFVLRLEHVASNLGVNPIFSNKNQD